MNLISLLHTTDKSLAKGELILEKDFENFVAARCETALLESEEYLKMEHEGSDQEQIQSLAETLCYQKGFNDAVKIFKQQ